MAITRKEAFNLLKEDDPAMDAKKFDEYVAAGKLTMDAGGNFAMADVTTIVRERAASTTKPPATKPATTASTTKPSKRAEMEHPKKHEAEAAEPELGDDTENAEMYTKAQSIEKLGNPKKLKAAVKDGKIETFTRDGKLFYSKIDVDSVAEEDEKEETSKPAPAGSLLLAAGAVAALIVLVLTLIHMSDVVGYPTTPKEQDSVVAESNELAAQLRAQLNELRKEIHEVSLRPDPRAGKATVSVQEPEPVVASVPHTEPEPVVSMPPVTQPMADNATYRDESLRKFVVANDRRHTTQICDLQERVSTLEARPVVVVQPAAPCEPLDEDAILTQERWVAHLKSIGADAEWIIDAERELGKMRSRNVRQ